MKRISILSFTDRGNELNTELKKILSPDYTVSADLQGEGCGSLEKRTSEAFKSDAVIFIGAAGIAVRAIAPFITDKASDPAVIVIDEMKRHVIPILSGHIGGANKLAERIAELIHSEAVITTATDLNDVFAVDSRAVEAGYCIENPELIKDFSAAVLRNEEVGVSVSPYLTDIFPKNLKLIPKCLVLGTGCKRGTDHREFEAFILDFLKENNIALSALSDLATIDLKKDEEAVNRFADRYNLNKSFYSASELASLPEEFDFSVSEFVEHETGVSNVCERSSVKRAMEICGKGRVRLLHRKHASRGMTAALAVYDKAPAEIPEKCIFVVGIGPGGEGTFTPEAAEALKYSDIVIGYKKYTELLGKLMDLSGKTVISSEMKQEKERCIKARDLAGQGKRVAVISSGDAGIYGMAGLIYEVCAFREDIEIEVIPGITAAIGGAALLGSPLTNDFAVISLSDHLTPRERILKRLEKSAEAGMVMVLYNPKSRLRPDSLETACEILLKKLPGETVCGVVKNIGREGQNAKLCTLVGLKDEDVDMFSTVFIGNSDTEMIRGKMVTKRGYE